QPTTMSVKGVGPDGVPGTGDDTSRFSPGQQGQAEFLLRGEKEGFHNIDFDIAGVLDGLPVGPVTITGTARGGVLVRNASFDVSFTVPAVVRRGEKFKLYATVTNIGQGLGNDVQVTIDSAALSGAHLDCDAPTPPSCAGSLTIPVLKSGDAKTLAFAFESDVTGQVVATYLHFAPAPGRTADAPTGSLDFTLGVGERGVPLSPDTLVLPAPLDRLPEDVVEAAMRVLGQAWSIANAPAGSLPKGVTRIGKAEATRKALALAEAGLRLGLGDPGQDSLEDDAVRDIALDFYGGSP